MTETRAIANLPGMEIEFRHKEASEENAEYLAISLRATPDFRTAVAWLDPFAGRPPLLPGLDAGARPIMVNPLLAWQQALTAMMSPWLSLMMATNPFLSGGHDRER